MKSLPILLTGLNILIGLFSLRMISTGHIAVIPYIVLLTAFIDFSDGFLARRLNAQTRIGCILDSASDTVCFVLVPAFYYFVIYQDVLSPILTAGVIFYISTGIGRLIRYTRSKLRYNVQSPFFIGCPVTAAAICVVLAAAISRHGLFHVLLIYICAYLMISRVAYITFSELINNYSRQAPFFIYVLLLLPFFLFYPLWVIFLISLSYLLIIPAKHIFLRESLNIGQFSKKRLPLARGARHIVVAGAVSFAASLLFLPEGLRIVYFLLILAFLFFFRDPERILEDSDSGFILSPADGKVIGVRKEFDKKTGVFLNKVSIFLSIFDVHVNRAPAALRILKREYRRGFRLDARNPKASANEHYLYTFSTDNADTVITMKQIAGRFARRIISYVNEGDTLKPGERLGLILFGSRVELFLPEGIEVLIKEGTAVKAGVTKIGAKRDGREPV